LGDLAADETAEDCDRFSCDARFGSDPGIFTTPAPDRGIIELESTHHAP
jgi:hypothetical protein